jgi:zinc transport system substrate-binding protein
MYDSRGNRNDSVLSYFIKKYTEVQIYIFCDINRNNYDLCLGGKIMTKYITILLLLLASFLTGCADDKNNTTTESGKASVYTTVYPLQYFSERIGGEWLTVYSIYPPGADEHTFEPSQRDMMNLADSDVFFYIGLGLEGFVDKAESTLKNEGVQFISLGENLHLEVENHEEETHEGESHEEDSHEEESHEHDTHQHGDIDPHVWLDPIYSKEMALGIKDSLVELMPEHKDTFEKNFKQLETELNALDTAFKETIGSGKHKEVIVSHAAFGYWEERYGLKQISISGLSSGAEPSQKELEQIVKTAKEKNLKYILFEQNVSSKLGEIIQDEIHAKPLPIHNLATLTDENIKNKETYFTIMEQNIDSLSKALND